MANGKFGDRSTLEPTGPLRSIPIESLEGL
jgi:hypothetical protein